MRPSLMIIFQIDVVGVAGIKSEGDSPVGSYGHGPAAFSAALQRVKPERWLVHVFGIGSLLQHGEDQTTPFDEVGSKLTTIIVHKEESKTFVFKALDHGNMALPR